MITRQPDTYATRMRSAAPARGARLRGRGCVLALACLASPVLASSTHDTTSGQAVTLEEVLLDENPGTLWVRFRFLAPEIRSLMDSWMEVVQVNPV